MLYKFTKENLTTTYDGTSFQYKIGEWVSAPGVAVPDGNDCGPNRLHLMKSINPKYAPPYFICHEAEGDGIIGESSEKAGYKRVRLVRTLTDEELDTGIDRDVWEKKLGRAGMWLPIAWSRKATFLDRPIDEGWVTEQLKPLHSFLGKKWMGVVCGDASLRASLRASLWSSLGDSLRDSLRASLRASLRGSLGASLRASLWDSLLYERGYTILGQPKPELEALLEVWKAGACPLGWDGSGQMIVIIRS